MVNRFYRFVFAPPEAIQCDRLVPPGLLRLHNVRTGVQVTQHLVHYTNILYIAQGRNGGMLSTPKMAGS
jgi:hypothetical protein